MTDPKVGPGAEAPAVDRVDPVISAILNAIAAETDPPELADPEIDELVEYDRLRFGGEAAE